MASNLSDPISIAGRAVKEAVGQDAELAAKARALADKCIDIANHYLDNGAPQVQLQVIKSIMPAIGRGMSEKGEDESIAQLRAELAALHQAVLGSSVA
jgi:hypothetical protein